MLRHIRLLCVFAAAVAAPCQTFAAEKMTVIQKRADRVIVELPNRMIVIAQRASVAPVVSAQVWVKTGSIYEQEHVGAGLSHYLEHLLSGGTTTTRSEEESTATLGRMGAQTNAATSLDTVRYYINARSQDSATAIELLSDWMQNSKILEREVDREKEVIQNEFAMGRGEPNRILWKLIQQARYTAHPARHPTIGYEDVFNDVTRDELYSFYRRMYVPNNMVFVVVGDIDPAKVADQIAGLWADVPAGKLPDLSFPQEPELEEPRRLQARANVRRPRITLAWPGTQLTEEGDYALDLLAHVLGDGDSSRLVREIRDEQALVTSIDAYNLSFSWGKGFFGVDAEVQVDPTADQSTIDAAIAEAEAAILKQIEAVKQDGVSDEELARAKRKTLAGVMKQGQTAQAIASRLARDTIGQGDPDYLLKYADAVQSLTSEQLQAAAKRFLVGKRQIRVTLMPLMGKEPTPIERAADAAGLDELKTHPVDLDNRQVIASLKEHLGKSDKTRSLKVEPVRMVKLDNGLRVLIQRSTIVPAASVQMYHLGGLLGDDPGREGVTHAAAQMRIKGTTRRTQEEIADTTADRAVSLSTSSGYNSSFTTASCLSEDVALTLELVADVTLNPTFPEDEWAKLQPRLVAQIERISNSWSADLALQFRQAYYSDFQWSHLPVGRRDVVSKLTAEQLRTFYQQRLAANDAVLAVFGDVNVDAVEKLVRKLFKAMPATAEKPFAVGDYDAPTKGFRTGETKSRLAAVKVGFGPLPQNGTKDAAALRVIGRVLNSFPSGWLEQELRFKRGGLAYAVWAYPALGLAEGHFEIGFNSNQPQRITEGVGYALETIARVRDEPIPAAELLRAKSSVITREVFGQQSNGDRAADAALNELYGYGYDHTAEMIRQIDAFTAKQVQAVAQKYLQTPVGLVLSNEDINTEALNAMLEPAPQPVGD